MYPGGHPVTRFGACILGVAGPRLSSRERALVTRVRPFGFILFARNIDTADQVRVLCAELRAAAGHDAPILIDQEGGRVQRLHPPLGRTWLPPMDEIARAGARAEEVMYARYRLIAAELRELGIDSNCAPLVDVATARTHAFLRNRCYGSDPETVAALGRAVSDGLMDGGVLPVVKHVPGHGRAVVDSHFDLPTVEAARDDLLARDFAPFRALADLPLAMTGHLVFPALDAAPSTLSPVIVEMIRHEIGFDGLLMTDDISMKALRGGLGALTAQALAAGCDVVLHCNGDFEELVEVTEAAGRLSDPGYARAARAIAARRPPLEVDMSALEAKLTAGADGRGDV